MPLLQVKDLKVHFKIQDGWVKAVDGVSFEIDSGETMGLVGESGCGKTTAAYAITQLLPSNGYIKGGHIFYKEPPEVTSFRKEYEERFRVARQSRDKEMDDVLRKIKDLAKLDDKKKAAAEEETLKKKLDTLQASTADAMEKLRVKEIQSLNKRIEQLPLNSAEANSLRARVEALEFKYDLLRMSMKKDGTLEEYNENIRAIRWKDISMIFQGAMNAFDPVYRIGDQIVEAIMLHEDVDEPAAKKRARELFEFVGISPDRIVNYPHEFSGGMKQRAMIALALALQPSFIIADEPTTALDVITQDRILAEILRLQNQLSMAMLIITHDVSVVAEVSDKIGVMYAGLLMEIGLTTHVFKNTAHPYTAGLLDSFPSIKGKKRRLASIPGFPPDLVNPPPGCPFHPRCQYAQPRCSQERPAGIEIEPGHLSYCLFARELWDKLRGKE